MSANGGRCGPGRWKGRRPSWPGATTTAARPAAGRPAPIRVWDLGDDTVRELKVSAAVNDLDFSPDSKQLAAACGDSRVRFWDARTGDALGDPLPLEAPATSVAFHPGGGRFVTTAGSSLQQWDAVKHTAIGSAVAFPDNGLRCTTTRPAAIAIASRGIARGTRAACWSVRRRQANARRRFP